ncbi:unnamed protein product [Parajaminaea phylloscopi]
MSKQLTGIIAAVPTPFTADGKQVDVEAIKATTERLIAAGVHGLVPTGTTGEFHVLSDDEYKVVIKGYVDAAAGRIPVVPGLGKMTTQAAIETAKFCEQAGAAAVMVVPPFYDPLPYSTLKKFLADVCDSINIPLMYYNLPGATGINLNADQIRELGQIKGLDYLKDTSGNAKEQTDVITQHKEGSVVLFNGWDTLTFSALALGGTAAIWGVASICPKECVEFFETLAVQGDLKKAREQWKFLWAVSDFLESVAYPSGIKAGLEIVGASCGPIRSPAEPLSKEDYKRFEGILAQRKY